MITFSILGRSALPIRAIPATTNNFFAPQGVISLLLDPESYYPTCPPVHEGQFTPLPLAHRVMSDGNISSMLPAEHLAWAQSATIEANALNKLPKELFVWTDELKGLVLSISDEIYSNLRDGYREPIAGSLCWNDAPYLSVEDAESVCCSVNTIEDAISSSKLAKSKDKRIKQYARDEKGMDPELQAQAETIAAEWCANGKRGNQLSKKNIAQEIARIKGFDTATVMRVIRLTWNK